jgi:hypothetical protein
MGSKWENGEYIVENGGWLIFMLANQHGMSADTDSCILAKTSYSHTNIHELTQPHQRLMHDRKFNILFCVEH